MSIGPGRPPRPLVSLRSALRLVCLVAAVALVSPLLASTAAAATGHVTGTLTANRAWTQAQVELYLPDDAFSHQSVPVEYSSADHTYSFFAGPGSYQLCATADGFEPACNNVTITSEGETVSDLAMVSLGEIAGKVLDEEDTPAPGVQVDFFDPAAGDTSGDAVATATTDENGEFRQPLTHGSYKVGFGDQSPEDTSGLQPEFYNDKHSLAAADAVAVTAGTTNTLGDTRFDPGASFTGRLTGPVGTERESIAVAALTQADGVWTEVRIGRLDASGDFTIAGLVSGTYRICARDENGTWKPICIGGATKETATDLTVTAPDQSAGRNLTMVRNGAIVGHVYAPGTVALSGISVQAIARSPGGQGAQTSTDGNGRYALPLAPGSYALRFTDASRTWASEYYNNKRVESAADTLTVTDGQDATAANAFLDRAASIAGTITAADPAEEVWNLKVAARNRETGVLTAANTVETDGTYRITGLAPGSYDVAFTRNQTGSYHPLSAAEYYDNVHEGPTAAPVPVELTAGDNRTEVDAALEPGATISGRVLNADGTAVTGCTVEVAWDDPHLGQRSATTDEEGGFAVRGLSTGHYVLAVNRPGAPGDSCTAATGYFDGDSFLGTAQTTAGFTTTLGQNTDAGTLSYPLPAPVNTSAPSVTGTAKVGGRLIAGPGAWTPAQGLTFTYAWKIGAGVVGTASTLPVTAAMARRTVVLVVTAHNTGPVTGVASSRAVGIAVGTITISKYPGITGQAKKGKTLHYVAERSAPTGLSRRLQWRRNGVAIPGATGASYKLVKADRKKRISLLVTYSRAGYATTSRLTGSTAKVR